MDPTENEQVMHAFLEEHDEFEADPTLAERLPEKAAPYVKDEAFKSFPTTLERTASLFAA